MSECVKLLTPSAPEAKVRKKTPRCRLSESVKPFTILKEQGFNNEDNQNDKQAEMLNKLMERQNQQLTSFFDKVD